MRNKYDIRDRKKENPITGEKKMPRNPKFHPPKSVLFITSSLEEGLLMKANPLIKSIISSCLAKAQALYPLRICHYIVQENHIHMIAVVDNPEHVSDFMERFKTESAHAINKLLGRKKRTVWCEGYDSPVLATPFDIIRKIAYLYLNPSKDGLVDSIEDFPNLSSWGAFKGNKREDSLRCIPFKRADVPRLSSLSPSKEEIQSNIDTLIGEYPEEKGRISFTIEPDAWMEVMGVKDRERINSRIKHIITRSEQKLLLKRKKEGVSTIGRERLIGSPIKLLYKPMRKAKRTFCISSQVSLRVHIIKTVKMLVEEGKRVLERWKTGDFSVRYPIGLYPPNMPRLVNAMPGAFF